MNVLLTHLRAATSPLHKRLDDLVPAFQPASGRAAYTEYLKRFHAGLSASWDALDWDRLESLSLPDVSKRKARYQALADDLMTLGDGVPPLACSSGSPDPVIVGCLYVLEGSVHGGSYLLKEIKNSAAGIPAGACGFLEGFGSENGRMWTSFVQWLGSLGQDPGFISEAEQSAIRTFGFFVDSFGSPTGKSE